MKNNLKTNLTVTALLLCGLIGSSLKAQEKNNIPSKNDFMVELNFKPFDKNVISFNQLRLKYKLADNWNLRLGLAFDKDDSNMDGEDYLPSQEQKSTSEVNITEFGVSPGIEYHFLKNSKISPYVGAEFSFFNKSVNSHYKDYQQHYDNATGKYIYIPVETDIDGADRMQTVSGPIYLFSPDDYIAPYPYPYYYREYRNRAYTSYGGNLLLGCDFYFMRNLYVGVEAGLAYNHIKLKTITTTVSNVVEPIITPSQTTNKFGFYYNSAIRLGFWF